MARRSIAALTMLIWLLTGHAVEVSDLWVRGDPAASEARMQAMLETASGDDALIILTQIARTWVFRKDFERAREILGEIEPRIGKAGPEAQVRFWLELGRSYASHQQPPETRTDATRASARKAYETALSLSQAAALDALTVDALHMLPFVETEPSRQLYWTERALDAVLESDQAAARRWEASIRNNLGETLFELTRYREALAQFERALALRERDAAAPATVRDASWHVARTLRMLGELERALRIQQRIADEAYAADAQRHYIHDELSLLYGALGDPERALHFAEHSAALKQ